MYKTIEIDLPSNDKINIEEYIKLFLAQHLSFSPEKYFFFYKKKRKKIVINFSDNEKDSENLFHHKLKKLKIRNYFIFLFILLLILGTNLLFLEFRNNNFQRNISQRQLNKNYNFHHQNELLQIKKINKYNDVFYDKIENFLRLPLAISYLYLDKDNVLLEASVDYLDLEKIGSLLEKLHLIDKTILSLKEEKVWISTN
jgi:hypothetical protein